MAARVQESTPPPVTHRTPEGSHGDAYAFMRFFRFSDYRASRILAEWHIMGQELKRGLHVVQSV